MKLALLTDLHANREAVEAVLDHAQQQGAERYAFLGDFVGYGADPGWVVDVVRAHVARGAVAVLGNHDLAIVAGASPGMLPAARAAVSWAREQLSEAQIAFLRELPISATDGQSLFVHANAFAPERWEYIQSRSEAVRSLNATNCPYTFCGHMHQPMLYHLSALGKAGEFKPTAGVAIPVPPHRQWLVVPGSVGQPRDGNPAACYAMFDDNEPSITYLRVPYDHAASADKIRAVGLPVMLADRLADGQ